MRVHVRENWYRDVWLAVITGFVVFALITAQDAIDQIQQSRLANCLAQDLRHDKTLQTLDGEIKRYEKGASPARRKEIEASRASSIALINQLAPHLNCVAAINREKLPRRPAR